MKSIKIFSIVALCLAFSTACIAQAKTESFNVSGNCGMCKSKIEKAAKEAGATNALWDVDKKEITITYNTASTNTAKIQKKIADVGYDNAGFKAKDESYKKLHSCCQYERKENVSKDACCKDGTDCCKQGEKDVCCNKEGDAKTDCCKKQE
jgi:periplasmic mercuric ion binding protein